MYAAGILLTFLSKVTLFLLSLMQDRNRKDTGDELNLVCSTDIAGADYLKGYK